MSEADALAKASSLLKEAKEESAKREKILASTNAKLDKLDEVSISPDLSFPKTREVLSLIGEELTLMKDKANEAKELTRKAKVVRKGLEDLRSYGKRCEKTIEEIYSLDQEGQFDLALEKCDSLLEPVIDYDYGMPLSLQEGAKGIHAWLKARLIWHKGESKIEEGLPPMELEEAIAYKKSIENLPIGVEDYQEKERAIDQANGFLFLSLAAREENIEHDRETFLSAMEYESFARECSPNSSDRTRRRAQIFKAILTDEYNELSYSFFNDERDYQKSLELFRLRGYFDPNTLTFAPYRFAYDEEEFRIYFLESEALKITPAEFEETFRLTSLEAKEPGDFCYRLLSHYLALQGLDDWKVGAMRDQLKTLPFQWQIGLFSKAMQLSMPRERNLMCLDCISQCEDKKGKLDEMSVDLLYLREHLDGEDGVYFSSILSEILRSPHAHKIAVKSRIGATHALFGEDRENFPASIGAPTKNPYVKSWSILRFALFVVLGTILPLSLCAFAIGLLYSASPISNDLSAFLCLIPLAGAAFVWWNLVRMHFGLDERASALNRRLMIAAAITQGLLAMLYFLFPSPFYPLARLGYGLLIIGIIEGLFAYFSLKPIKGKKAVDNLLLLALLAIEGVGLAYMILDMMNGAI